MLCGNRYKVIPNWRCSLYLMVASLWTYYQESIWCTFSFAWTTLMKLIEMARDNTVFTVAWNVYLFYCTCKLKWLPSKTVPPRWKIHIDLCDFTVDWNGSECKLWLSVVSFYLSLIVSWYALSTPRWILDLYIYQKWITIPVR